MTTLDHEIVVAASQGEGVRVTAGTADDDETFLAAAVAFARLSQ